MQPSPSHGIQVRLKKKVQRMKQNRLGVAVRLACMKSAFSAIIGMSFPMSSKRKIAVLGGGVGAMSTVFELTSVPGWEERFEITVYQNGLATRRQGRRRARPRKEGSHL